MTWRKIVDNQDSFIRVYEVSPRMSITASFFPINELPPIAIHIDIANKPSSDHIWNDAQNKWVLNLENYKVNKKSILEAQAREAHFQTSSEKALLDTANLSIDVATTKTQIDAITL